MQSPQQMSSRRPSIRVISTSDGGNLCGGGCMTVQNTFIPVNSHSPTGTSITERDPLQMTPCNCESEDYRQMHPIHNTERNLTIPISYSFDEKISPTRHRVIYPIIPEVQQHVKPMPMDVFDVICSLGKRKNNQGEVDDEKISKSAKQCE